jgi:hypothetical protein
MIDHTMLDGMKNMMNVDDDEQWMERGATTLAAEDAAAWNFGRALDSV